MSATVAATSPKMPIAKEKSIDGSRGSALKSAGATRNSCIFARARAADRMVSAVASGLIGCRLVKRVHELHQRRSADHQKAQILLVEMSRTICRREIGLGEDS